MKLREIFGWAALSLALLCGPALAQTVNVHNLPSVVDTNSGAPGASTLRFEPANTSAADGGWTFAQGSTTSGQKGGLGQCAVTTASPTYTTGQTDPCSMDVNGGIRVNVIAGVAGGGAVTANTGAFAAGGATDGWNLTEGTKADTAYAGSGSASIVAILKGIYANSASGSGLTGSATPTSAILMGGTDGTDLRGLLTDSAGLLQGNITKWDSTALGVPTAYGTAPSTGNYIGVNAFVTDPPVSPANFTPAQVSVAATATQIAASRTGRNLIDVVNTTTTAVYLGGSGVTTSTGLLLPGIVGASVTIPFTGALYGIVATGTATVTEAETY